MTESLLIKQADVVPLLQRTYQSVIQAVPDPDAFEDMFTNEDGGSVAYVRDHSVNVYLHVCLVENPVKHSCMPRGIHSALNEIERHLITEAEKLVERLIADFQSSLPANRVILPSKDTDLNGLPYKNRVTIELLVVVYADYDYYRIEPVYEVDEDDRPEIVHDDEMEPFTLSINRSITILTSDHDPALIQSVIVCAN